MTPPLSIYVHLPWCVRKCPYCDFNSHTAGDAAPKERYINALLKDLAAESKRAAGRAIYSVFLGGGTPSLFSPQEMDKILTGVRARFGMVEDVEVTMEANPGTVECGSPAGYRLAIYPTEATIYADAAAGADPGVITSGAAGVFQLADDGDEDQVQINGGFEMQFRLSSPRQRMYVVDTPVSFICDPGAGTLTRYWGYAIAAAQPEDPAVAPLSAGNSARVANDITSCDIDYTTSTATHSGLITIDLTAGRDGEQVRLLQQIHVSNSP